MAYYNGDIIMKSSQIRGSLNLQGMVIPSQAGSKILGVCRDFTGTISFEMKRKSTLSRKIETSANGMIIPFFPQLQTRIKDLHGSCKTQLYAGITSKDRSPYNGTIFDTRSRSAGKTVMLARGNNRWGRMYHNQSPSTSQTDRKRDVTFYTNSSDLQYK